MAFVQIKITIQYPTFFFKHLLQHFVERIYHLENVSRTTEKLM